jgi:hypothetical protein
MTIDLNALSGRIKAEETAADICRVLLADRSEHRPLGDRRRALRLVLEEKEKWLRENRALYAQEIEKRRVSNADLNRAIVECVARLTEWSLT